MRKLVSKLTIFCSLFVFTIPLPAIADSGGIFNPNFIISDEELRDSSSMDRSDIQAFLEDKDSYLTTFRTNDWEGTKRRASDIIYRSAKDNVINPKYLLVKLQKEQSLITDPDPTQKALDWATGYGVCDSCSMSDPDIQKFKGFGKQVDNAAGIMSWYYEHVSEEPWIKKSGRTYNIDGEKVKPANLATAFLYTYTPHILGNENFWKLWQRWFEQVYPDGSLIKAQSDNTVYLIQDGFRRPIANMTALITRFDPKMIITVPDAEIDRYEDGYELSLPNWAILKNGSKYYLVDYDEIRPFESYTVVKQLGYHPDEIIEVADEDIEGYKLGATITSDSQAPLGRLVKIEESGEIYYIKNNMYHSIPDEQIAKTNFSNLYLEEVPAGELSKLDSGDVLLLKNGTLFGVKGSSRIYVVENGRKRHIASEEVFNGLGYDWENIVWVNQIAGMLHKSGQPLYLKADLDPTGPVDRQVIASEDVDVEDEDVMQRTMADDTKYIGDKYATEIDAYLVADYDTKEIIAGKNIDVERSMASFVKTMTGYRLLKEGLNTRLGVTTYDSADHQASYHSFRAVDGEKFQNLHLMYAMLISSKNTPSRMLVDKVEENESEFIARMNEQAVEWGLEKTKFADTSGLKEDNVSTAKEYLTLFTNALKNVELRTILGLKSYQYDEVKDLDGKPHHYDDNSNSLTAKTDLPFKIIASKTGYIPKAGTGLAMIVERNKDGKRFVVITMGCPWDVRKTEPEKVARWAVGRF